ncbi:hypothetical protein AB0N20_31990 [Streptomyces griseoincarnatus]
MRVFLLGLFLGGLSGCLTYAHTGDDQVATTVGILVAVAAWLGIACIVIAGESRPGSSGGGSGDWLPW